VVGISALVAAAASGIGAAELAGLLLLVVWCCCCFVACMRGSAGASSCACFCCFEHLHAAASCCGVSIWPEVYCASLQRKTSVFFSVLISHPAPCATQRRPCCTTWLSTPRTCRHCVGCEADTPFQHLILDLFDQCMQRNRYTFHII
jgi:hypothetical protein